MLNSVYIGSNETFSSLSRKVDLLSKGGFQFPKYIRKDNTLLTCKWHPILRDSCSISSWVTSEVSLWRWSFSQFSQPHLPTLFLTTTQEGIRNRLTRNTKSQNWKQHLQICLGNIQKQNATSLSSQREKMQNLELNFWPLFLGHSIFPFYNYLWLLKFRMVHVVLYITATQSIVYRLVLVGKMLTVYEYVSYINVYIFMT